MKKIVSILVALALLVSMVPTVFAVGEWYDPQILTALGEYTVSAPEGYAGYNLSYTADKSGMLTLTLADHEDNYYIGIRNERTYEEVYCDSDYGVSSAGVEIAVGDVVSISVMACDASAQDITFSLSLEEYEVEVYIQLDLYEDEWTFPCDSALIPAGESVKYKIGDMLGGGMMTVTGADAFVEIGDDTLTPDENGVIYIDFTKYEGDPVQGWFNVTYYYDMYIGNNGAVETTFKIGYWYPEGTQSNPKVVEAGTYECTIDEGVEAYYYMFNAPVDCVVTVTVESEDSWYYQLYNLGTYEQGDWHYAFDGASNTDSIVAYEGDPVRLQVGAMNEFYEYTGGTFKVTFTYEEVDIYPGSQYQPFNISAYECPTTIDLEAGASAYYQLDGFSTYSDDYDFVMTGEGGYVIMDGVKYEAVDGVVTVPVTESGVVVLIGNSSDAAVTYEVANPFPVGSYNNPEYIVLDKEYVLDLEAGAGSYNFTWNAEEAGELTIIALSETGWKYSMYGTWNYNTTGTQHYAKDPLYTQYGIQVSAGEEVLASVSTYDSEDPYGSTPEGTVKFMFVFEPNLTLGENTVELEEDDADGDSWIYVAEQSGILDISVTGIKLYDVWGELTELTEDDLLGYFTRNGGNFHLSVNGVDILNPSQQILVSWGDVVEIEMYNMSAAWAEIDLELTMIDYTELVLGDNEFTDDGNGSYFVYYPETNGNLTLEFTELYYYDSVEIAMPWHPCLPISDAAALVGMTVNGVAVAENPVTVAVEAGTPVVIYLCDIFGREIKGSLNLSVKAVETIYDLPYNLEGELTADDCEEGLLWKYTATQTGVIIGTSENVDDVDAWVTVYVNGEPYNLFDGVIVYEGDEVVFNLAAYEAGSYSCELSWMELVLGDVNLDGNVDILDANLAAAYYNERVELSDLQIGLADVNGVDGVDILDANLIAAFYNERIDKFPVEE